METLKLKLCKALRGCGSALKRFVIRRLFFESTGQCYRCPHCFNRKINWNTKDRVEGVISEVSLDCDNCGANVGYWAYGNYDPEYVKDYCENPAV